MSVEAIATDETLLILKIGFLVLLYLFIVLIARTATKDIGGAPQESIVLGAGEAARLRAEAGVKPGRLLVVASAGLRVGETLDVSGPTVVGREGSVGIRLEDDDYVSARHARLEPRLDGLWVEDLGSTNGTFVDGARIDGARRLQRGEVVRIGSTELRLES